MPVETCETGRRRICDLLEGKPVVPSKGGWKVDVHHYMSLNKNIRYFSSLGSNNLLIVSFHVVSKYIYIFGKWN